MVMICPIVIKNKGYQDQESRILWKQPRPQSQNSHKPIVLQLGKETVESLKIYGPITREMADIENTPLDLTVKGHSVKVSVKIRTTALDRKAADAVTGLRGAFCDLCYMSSDDAHDLGELEEELMMSRTFEGTKELAATLLNEKGVFQRSQEIGTLALVWSGNPLSRRKWSPPKPCICCYVVQIGF